MRYDTPIYFQKVTPGEYDEETGDYGPETVSETVKYASVADTTLNMQQVVYGQVKQNSITAHIQNRYKDPFSTIRIGDHVYSVDYRKRHRTKETFVLSEVIGK